MKKTFIISLVLIILASTLLINIKPTAAKQDDLFLGQIGSFFIRIAYDNNGHSIYSCSMISGIPHYHVQVKTKSSDINYILNVHLAYELKLTGVSAMIYESNTQYCKKVSVSKIWKTIGDLGKQRGYSGLSSILTTFPLVIVNPCKTFTSLSNTTACKLFNSLWSQPSY